MRFRSILIILLLVPLAIRADSLPVPRIPYAPQHYVCYQSARSLTIDGRLDEPAWENTPWTELFVDIEGNLKPAPRFKTRAKLLWDSSYLYVGAELQEPEIWATLTQRDAVIYHDNDFEVFIDPDMDTHQYYELELNALNTVWDLLLIKPYRDGGPAVNAWDIQGLKSAVSINGTPNHSGDTDSGWSVEIALPWPVLSECAHRPTPPNEGDQWKLNFSRVEWDVQASGNGYTKKIDPVTGKSLPEHNWVWSPQGLIAMHYPEMWGLVQFTKAVAGSRSVPFITDPVDSARWALRLLFYAERNYCLRTGRFTSNIVDLKLEPISPSGFDWPPVIEATTTQFSALLISRDGKIRLSIFQDGWLEQDNR